MRYSFMAVNHSVTYGCEPCLPEQFAAAAAAGFDFVSPDIATLRAHGEAGVDAKAIAAALSSSGASCLHIAGLGMSPSWETMSRDLDEMLSYSEALGAKDVISFSFEPATPDSFDNMRRTVGIAADHGFDLEFEFIPYGTIRTIPEALELCEVVGSERVTLVVDSWHVLRSDRPWADLEVLPLERIGTVHFDDAFPIAEESSPDNSRHRRCRPGDGEFDLARFRDVICSKGFDGIVEVEVLSTEWRERPVAEFTAAMFEATKEYWG